MAQPNYTEGPWLAAEAVSSVVGLPVVKAGVGGGRVICNVNCAADPIHGKVPGDDAFNREALANARLIAAAPVMLDALKRAKEVIRIWHGPNAWEIYDRASPEMKAINSAIAAAKAQS